VSSKPYSCAHCHQPCGLTGHLRRINMDLLGARAEACPSVGAIPIDEAGEVRYGFVCPDGHTCYTASALAQAFGRTTMPPPAEDKKNWRSQPATPRQLEFLDYLGYLGPVPSTKGQAHDLIDRIKSGAPQAELEELRRRGILLRD
jgi:hypothetical protein